MKVKQAGWAVAALATAFAAPAVFAQAAVTSSTGAAVTSGTGVVVTPGAPSTVVVPGATVVLPTMIPGATTVAIGPAQVTTEGRTTTTVTRYWANVPAGVTNEAEFQRWMRLK